MMNRNIAGVNYPLRNISTDGEKLILTADIEGFAFELSIEPIINEPYIYLSSDVYGNPIFKDQRKNRLVFVVGEKTFFWRNHHSKISQVYALSDRFICSCFNELMEHVIVILNYSYEILSESKIGISSWHSPRAIDSFGDVIMYAEYPHNKAGGVDNVSSSIFVSHDKGVSWSKSLEFDYPDIRHWHTCAHRNGVWIATSGDSYLQSRWFRSVDSGSTWTEVTDKYFKTFTSLARSSSAHRTTCFEWSSDEVYYGTDDILGEHISYFIVKDGRRVSSSRFMKATITNFDSSGVVLTELCSLGLHIRSIIKVESGWLLISEAQYISSNWQVYFIGFDNPSTPYFLLSIPCDFQNGGTNSVNSDSRNGVFYTKCSLRQFLGLYCAGLKWNFKRSDTAIFPGHDLSYFVLSENLWFLFGAPRVAKVFFKNYSVALFLNTGEDGDTCSFALGAEWGEQLVRELNLFRVNCCNHIFSFFILFPSNVQSCLHVHQYDESARVILVSEYLIEPGFNQIHLSVSGVFLKMKFIFILEAESSGVIEINRLGLSICQG